MHLLVFGNSMGSRYTLEEQQGYLVMRISGPYDYWDFLQYPDLIRKCCESAGVYRILVDVVAVTYAELPTIELFFLGEKVAEVLRDQIKIALVWHGDTKDNLLQMVAANRAASIRIFETTETAALWLLYDHEDEPFDFRAS